MDDAEGDCPGTEAVRRGLIEVQKQLAELEEKAYRDAHVWGQHTTIAVQHGHDEDAALAAEEGQACVAVALILELAREILGERLAKGSRMEELLGGAAGAAGDQAAHEAEGRLMLTMLPCGGLGELDERGETMRIDCRLHREWLRDQATGAVLVAYVKGTMEYLYRDHPSCGAVTVLAPGTGIRIVLGGPETRREDMAHLPHAEGSAA